MEGMFDPREIAATGINAIIQKIAEVHQSDQKKITLTVGGDQWVTIKDCNKEIFNGFLSEALEKYM